VSSRSSGKTADRGSRDCANGTTHDCANDCAGRRAASGPHSGRNRLSTRRSCRIGRFSDLVSSCGSGHASNGGSHGRADGTTQDRTSYCTGRRAAGGSQSGTNRMRTRLSRRCKFLVQHMSLLLFVTNDTTHGSACTAELAASNS